MATNTPKLNLVKPDMADFADIRVLNQNMDILDREVGGLDYVKNVTKSDTGLTFTKKDDSQIQVPLNYMPVTGGNFTGDITVQNKNVVTVVDSYYNEDKSTYWIKYSDGTLVQHFSVTNDDTFTNKEVTLIVPFIDTNYYVGFVGEVKANRNTLSNTSFNPSISGVNSTFFAAKKTPTGFTCIFDAYTDNRYCCVGRWK